MISVEPREATNTRMPANASQARRLEAWTIQGDRQQLAASAAT
ncbi:hypothetical protein [Lentzea albida]|uniref:Uncharacterized protein n=1 Tax=Lentzea albida TaxID=65499 RepID=A0A1H9VS44_9PSEU|nr:hypothetical protein [Lentzea albida]SES24392.1 hypothetical protein SAMN04488000_11974 [Lentzea albida]